MKGTENEALFSDGDLRQSLEAHFARIQEFVEAIPKAQFLATADDELYQHVYDTFISQHGPA